MSDSVAAAEGVADTVRVRVPEEVDDGLGIGGPDGDELGDDPVDALGVGVALGVGDADAATTPIT